MRSVSSWIKHWLPVVVWMGVIFSASTDALSARNTSRFIGPVLRWFAPEISDATIRQVQVVVRKGAHVAEYAILAMLLWWALGREGNSRNRVGAKGTTEVAADVRRRQLTRQSQGTTAPTDVGGYYFNWRRALIVSVIAILYAASDEFHQSFVPSRDGHVRDVLIDTAGVLLGLGVVWIRGRWKQRP